MIKEHYEWKTNKVNEKILPALLKFQTESIL